MVAHGLECIEPAMRNRNAATHCIKIEQTDTEAGSKRGEGDAGDHEETFGVTEIGKNRHGLPYGLIHEWLSPNYA